MTVFEKYSLWIGFGGVLATFFAVIVAIWGERIRQRWKRPKLILTLNEPALTLTTSGIKGWYYLICVRNEKRTNPAQNVRILLTRVFKQGPDGAWKERRFSGPTQVQWRWPGSMPQYSTVGPNELATFGYLHENSDEFILQLYTIPNNLQRHIPKNDPTRLEFIAVSDTVQSPALIIEISWDGEWVEGRMEMQEHFIVNEVIV